MKTSFFKLSLNMQIGIGALIGIGLGIYLNTQGSTNELFPPIIYFADLLGSIFINLLKMILIPLVFISITVGIANLRAHAQMNRVWQVTMIYFLCTAFIATIIGILAVKIFGLGKGLEISLFAEQMASFKAQDMTLSEFIKSFFGNLFVNPVKAMATGEVMATVVFALLFGAALVSLGEKARGIINLFNEIFAVIMKIVDWVMCLAPIGIMALLTKMIATQDMAILPVLGKYMAVVMGVTLFHGIVILPLILFLLTGYNPIKFFLAIREAMITAFSTSSSSATLPVTLRCVENNLKVDKNIAGFVVSIGATVNMDGTALYEALAAMFIANLMGIELNIVQQFLVAITAVLASVGAPGIPSAGMVTMIMVLQSVGLPVEAIAILLPIDRPLDAIRTMVNVEGDCTGSLIAQKFASKK